jgi:hypothetical protein
MSPRYRRTDFETFGLSYGPLDVVGRNAVLTVDFEAFDPATLTTWIDAVKRWAEHAYHTELRFAFFIALENVAVIRHKAAKKYGGFTSALRELVEAGSIIYAHNHGPFDTTSGSRTTVTGNLYNDIADYSKRASFFYDTVIRNNIDIGTWFTVIDNEYRRLLDDVGVKCPIRPAFRAGGWDHGSSETEVRSYVTGIRRSGFAIDSSATSGTYGTRSWRVGAPYGENIFSLGPELKEIAACWNIDCGARTFSGRTARSLLRLASQSALLNRRRDGAFVVVIHFDHLFHSGRAAHRRSFAVLDKAIVAERINSFMTPLAFFLRRGLGLKSVTFDDLVLRELKKTC